MGNRLILVLVAQYLVIAVVAAVDVIRGIAVSVNAELIDIPGATGYLDRLPVDAPPA